MTGTINITTRDGGKIHHADKGMGWISFKWCDAVDFGPMDVGHGSPVTFVIINRDGYERAINVRVAV